MPSQLSEVRALVEGTWNEVARWLAAKPGIFGLPHPEQQIAFEYADRLRVAIRQSLGVPSWDRLYFDASSVSLDGAAMPIVDRRAPIYVDSRQLFGLPAHASRDANLPDLAASVQVLRSAPEAFELDEDGRPRRGVSPSSIRDQGWLLEQHVAHLDELSGNACDAFLFVVYSNDARRSTAVDRREVASWASWHQLSNSLFWASRHFRARPKL